MLEIKGFHIKPEIKEFHIRTEIKGVSHYTRSKEGFTLYQK